MALGAKIEKFQFKEAKISGACIQQAERHFDISVEATTAELQARLAASRSIGWNLYEDIVNIIWNKYLTDDP